MKLLFKKQKTDKYDEKKTYLEGLIYEFTEERGQEILDATKDVEIMEETVETRLYADGEIIFSSKEIVKSKNKKDKKNES